MKKHFITWEAVISSLRKSGELPEGYTVEDIYSDPLIRQVGFQLKEPVKLGDY